jgi:hypothetical protein
MHLEYLSASARTLPLLVAPELVEPEECDDPAELLERLATPGVDPPQAETRGRRTR